MPTYQRPSVSLILKEVSPGTLLKLHFLVIALFLSSCATLPQHPPKEQLLAYGVAEEQNLLNKFAPVFVIERPDKPHNRIGSPLGKRDARSVEHIFIDPKTPSLYTEIRKWQTSRGSYTNLIYRIHFPEIPFKIVPFYLGTGKNTGLLVIITLDDKDHPLLYTTVNTCGCYLSFSPTSHMQKTMFPPGWQKKYLYVYGEYLPGFLDFGKFEPPHKSFILLRQGTHRVKDIWISSNSSLADYPKERAILRPMKALEKIPMVDGTQTSFFETEGPRKHYVKGSSKIWERLLISWWAFDWRVGEDKRYGKDTTDGITFYTSLKPWAREESDLRDFAGFLRYWQWNF